MTTPARAAPPPAAASRISVGLREFSVDPSSNVGRAGRVTFAVRNAGAVPHEFLVISTDKPAGELLKGARGICSPPGEDDRPDAEARPLRAALQPAGALQGPAAHRLHGAPIAAALP